jgi:hypothetical protein
MLGRSDVDMRGTYDGIRVAISINGNSYADPVIDEVGIGYAFYEYTWAANPATSAPWTWADINQLIAGASTAKTTRPTDTKLYVDYVEVVISYGEVSNTMPVASNVAISGTAVVGSVITGNYAYADAENDPEQGSIYKWYRADDSAGTNMAALSDRTELTCEIPISAQDKYVFFEVTPVAKTGVLTGMPVMSLAFGPVAQAEGTAPSATSVQITGKDSVGAILTASYAYADLEGDAEGISQYRWISGGFVISGATGLIYALTRQDEGKMIVFEVTPVAATGSPATGNPVASAPFGPIAPALGSAPQAGNVVINGTGTIGSTISGAYSFSDADGDSEGGSMFRWLRNGTPIDGATKRTYVLTSSDAGALIVFEVTPVSATGYPNTGTPVMSEALKVEQATDARVRMQTGQQWKGLARTYNLRGQIVRETTSGAHDVNLTAAQGAYIVRRVSDDNGSCHAQVRTQTR